MQLFRVFFSVAAFVLCKLLAHDVSIGEWREQIKGFGKDIGEAADVSFSDIAIPTRDGAALRSRLFHNDLSDRAPLLVFYPGCAFIFDFFELHSVICSRLAKEAGIKVLLVQFRLVPEYPMPTSLEDSYDAFQYIAKRTDVYGIDPSRVLVGGWCSGANAATYVSGISTCPVFHQILISGTFDLMHSCRAYDCFEEKDETASRSLVETLAHSFLDMDDPASQIFSPIAREDFSTFPPTTVIFGEFDALRNDSEAYFAKLMEHKIDAKRVPLAGAYHNTIVGENGYQTVVAIAREIQYALHRE